MASGADRGNLAETTEEPRPYAQQLVHTQLEYRPASRFALRQQAEFDASVTSPK